MVLRPETSPLNGSPITKAPAHGYLAKPRLDRHRNSSRPVRFFFFAGELGVNQTEPIFSRINLDDQCLGRYLTFDGSSTVVNFGVLANDGSATPVAVPNITTTSLNWTCTSVTTTTWSVGLAEIVVCVPTAAA